MVSVGFIGAGTIGSHLIHNVGKEVAIDFVVDQDPTRLSFALDIKTARSIDELGRISADLVVEAATAVSLKQYIDRILESSDLLPFSITAFADDEFSQRVHALSERYNRRVFIPHGAILGVDGIWDGRSILESVSITTTKNGSLGATEQKTGVSAGEGQP
jgi:aspartate dehydrogenase